MKKVILFIFLWLMMIGAMNAQNLSFQSFLNNNPFSFLNNNKLSMHHSFSFTTISNSKNTLYFSDYTNRLNYRLSSKLSLQMDLHFLNFGGVNYNNGFSNLEVNNSQKINFIPEFILNYHPSDNFNIIFQYSRGLATQQNFYNGFYNYGK